MDIVQADQVQENLFDKADSDHAIRLMRTVDKINRVHGKHTVTFAAEGINKRWSMKRDLMSPAYTTRWSEIPIVR
jgi:DNA polymerase V